MIAVLRWLVLACLLALPFGARAADDLPVFAHTTVNDFAGILTPADTQVLDEALIALKQQTGVEGTVVILPDRTRYGSESLEAFSRRLFDRWGVGDAQRNDGFMMLIIPSSREMRIALGAGYGRDYDVVADDIFGGIMGPAFRAGDLSQGVRDGTLAVIERIARPLAARTGPPPRTTSWTERLLPLAVFGVFGFTGLSMVRSLLRRRRGSRCPQCGAKVNERIEGTPSTLPGGIPTTGTVRLQSCPKCGWTAREAMAAPVMLPARRWGRDERGIRSGGGGGGFGGGRSGGGGASGGW